MNNKKLTVNQKRNLRQKLLRTSYADSNVKDTVDDIERGYNVRCKKKSDINEHLPTLKKYATGLDTVIEMGVREVVSTYAILNARPNKVISYDIYESSNIKTVSKDANNSSLNYEFRKESTLTCDIPECDMLFIDTLHVYEQLVVEINRHEKNVKRYMVFHDTETFKHSGELKSAPNGCDLEIKETNKGLWDAIIEFLDTNSQWTIKEVFKNNNGLTILERV